MGFVYQTAASLNTSITVTEGIKIFENQLIYHIYSYFFSMVIYIKKCFRKNIL